MPKKTKGFIEKGFVNPSSLKWNSNFEKRVRDLSKSQVNDMLNESDLIYHKLYEEHPFKKTKNGQTILDEILGNKQFSSTFELKGIKNTNANK